MRKLSGVLCVSNHITVKPHASLADIKLMIASALKRWAKVEADGIRVTVQNADTVTLDGIVHDWHERQRRTMPPGPRRPASKWFTIISSLHE